jgi:hypothetical protein
MTDPLQILAATPIPKQCAHPGCVLRPRWVVVLDDGGEMLVTHLCTRHMERLKELDQND